MPTYKYQCKKCDHIFDHFQSISAVPLTDCPSCSEPELKRLVSGGLGVIFKGSGFYVNDSRGKASSTSTKKANGDGGGSDTAAAGAADGTSGSGDASKQADSAKKSGGEAGTGSKAAADKPASGSNSTTNQKTNPSTA